MTLFVPSALLFALTHPASAEPNRVTASLSAGVDGRAAAVHGSMDYGVVRHVAIDAEGGADAAGSLSLGGGVLVLPIDDQWVRAGLVVASEVGGLGDQPRLAGRAGLRAGWLMFWGLGLQGRLDVVFPVADAPEVQAGFGLSVRV